MKDLNSLSRRRKPKELKLVCSFNGSFHPRPPSGKLRYVGGETRIISVDRNIAYPVLKSKVLELFFTSPNGNRRPFSLVYHLPRSAEEENAPLVLVTCDDDVCCMIEQYERLESYGTHPRLWIFVCHGNVIGNSCGGFSSRLITRAPTATTTAVFSSSAVDKKGPHLVKKDTPCLGGGDKVKKQVRANDDSLRKLVLKQQLLAKQSTEIGVVQIANDAKLGFDQETEVNSDDQKVNSHESIVGFCVGKESRNPGYVIDSYRMNGRDDEISCGNMGNYLGSRSHPLNPTDENVRVKSDVQLNSLSRQSHYFVGDGERCGCLVQPMKSSSDTRVNVVGNTNRENIVPRSSDYGTVQTAFAPLYCSSNLVGSVCPQKFLNSGFYSSTRSHSIGLGGRRNPRACPYHVKNRENSRTELENPRDIKLDGRSWIGRLQPGLRSSWNISKPVQDIKMYYPTSWRVSSVSHLEEVEGMYATTDYCQIKQTCSFDGPCGNLENLAMQDGHGFVPSESPSLKGSHLGTIFKSIGTSVVCTKTSEEQIDPSTSSERKLHEIPQQIDLEMPRNGTNYCNIKKETKLMHQQEAVNISDIHKNPVSDSETGTRCGSLSTIEARSQSFTEYQNHSYAQEDGITSSLELSLHNLSLSSFKVMDPPSASLAAASDVAEPLLTPQSNLYDVMDEGCFGSGPQVDKSSEATSTASSPKRKNDNDEKETTQHLQFNISMDEKERRECSKFNGRIPTDLADFYTHLATRELQAISNSDLEYIKELGSGTYGTVFYGKWKGSDVAIKKLKTSCLTEGSVEEERVVANFWKEAHLLGQLHHPNVVALYGVVTDGPVTNFATATEYMVNGSLKQVLRRKDRTIDRRKRLIIAMDAAFGMEYLHGKDIVHFDLKSHNFLVNMKDPQRPVCKIGDLGLSKIKQKTLVSGGIRGTIPWMAPELLNAENMVTEKVDVYSFGIVMWELLTGEEPYAKMRSEEILGGLIKGTLRPEVPSWCDPAWRSLMERCWSSNADARPAFSEIAKELRAMAATMNIK